MKFGKYLQDKSADLPGDWSAHCLDYTKLKLYIKHNVVGLKLDRTDLRWKSAQTKEPSFAELVTERLAGLKDKIGEFIVMLDAEVNKVTLFFEAELSRLTIIHLNSAKAETSDEELLQSVFTLERFVFLNYTGIVKILKKHDRHSGIPLSEPYLTRVSTLPFIRSEALVALKQTLMNSMSSTPSSNSTTLTSAVPNGVPIILRQQLLIKELAPLIGFSRQPRAPVYVPPQSLLPQQRVLVSLSGPHGTDIIAALLHCCEKHGCQIEDFMLSRLYHNVTFGVLITMHAQGVSIFNDLAEAAQRWDAVLQFDVADTAKYEPKAAPGSEPLPDDFMPRSISEAPYINRVKYSATILNQSGLSTEFLYAWTRLLLEHKISVERMSRLNLEGPLTCADYRLSVPRSVDMEILRKALFELSRNMGTDVALQLDDVFRKNKRLVVFDMDSTLIQQEVIDEIARFAGIGEGVAKITELAMNGEIDFKESLRRRVGLLKGTPVSVIDEVREILTFTEGARFLCRALKKIGFKLAVISGGFMPLARYVKAELGLDYAFANNLQVSPDGLHLTGLTTGPIVDGLRKAELLEVIAQAEGVTLDQVIAVGDGANDLWMLGKAGLGIAFNAKPKVQEQARARINQRGLECVLYLLGYTDEDARQLSENF